ncbi:MAG: two-component sensor histidine kinase, partial [Campylobacter sp.]|nr:two-component sensor histidine kinase [Campylobacter sp.]
MSDDIKNTLESLIEQTYKVEKEYKSLSASYENMQKFVKEIVESLGAALWVVDKSGNIVIQNTLASSLDAVFGCINLGLKSQEIEQNASVYAVKITQSGEHSVILATDISAEKRSARLVSMGAVAAHLSHEIRN